GTGYQFKTIIHTCGDTMHRTDKSTATAANHCISNLGSCHRESSSVWVDEACMNNVMQDMDTLHFQTENTAIGHFVGAAFGKIIKGFFSHANNVVLNKLRTLFR